MQETATNRIRVWRCMVAVILCVALMLVCLPAVARADDDYEGSGTSSDPWLIGADTASAVQAYVDDTTLYVKGSGEMADLVSSGYTNAPWAKLTSFTSVSIGKGVTSIGSQAFRGCKYVKSVSLPETLTTISSWAFYDCSGLKSISIPSSVTTIADSAFYNCTSLSTIYFFHTASDSLTIARNAFHCETRLATDVYIPYLTKDVNQTIWNYDWSESNSSNPSLRSVSYFNYYDEDADPSSVVKTPQYITVKKATRKMKASKLKKKAIKRTFTIKGAKTNLKAKAVGKKAKKALKIKVKSKTKVVVKVKKKTKKGTYKVNVWATETSQYKAAIEKTITIKVKK
ncbi:MAG: leucine-rich repeat domain-containing protein [Bacteroidales bacterium]|nr:leucine-rich repeat domain-containing protein [Bacteroidales bacterium]